MKTKTKEYDSPDGKYHITEYGSEDGCGGCKVNSGSIQCKGCFDWVADEYNHFQPLTEVYKYK